MPCWTRGSSQACSQLERNHFLLDGWPEVLGHVVVDVEIDRHTHEGLKLIFELGDVEQRYCSGHAGGNGGENVEVAAFMIITPRGRTKQLR